MMVAFRQYVAGIGDSTGAEARRHSSALLGCLKAMPWYEPRSG